MSGRDPVGSSPAGPPTEPEEFPGWPAVLARLAAGEDLPGGLARAALTDVLEGNATAAQIAAFAFGLRIKGETVEELAGLVAAMLSAAESVQVDRELRLRLVDTCGTGGDRSGTANVSTMAALVVAGAGVPVCKHGGRAASSHAGSADVLEALGVVIELGADGVARCIAEAGIGFCFAPRFHPAMRHALPVRRELGVPTAFNLLGPLANPARVTRQVVGVGDPAVAAKMVRVLAAGGAERAMVVHGAGGLDELSTIGPSVVHEYSGGSFREFAVDPAELGLAPSGLEELRGGDARRNADLLIEVLSGEGGAGRRALRDIVALNAGAALVVAGRCSALPEGVDLARSVLAGGDARRCLDRLISASQAAATA